ncbi:MAG: sugar transferase [Actinobacteria bacterium]|nr:sugar transferase [Actinomycetota bacterium]
MTVVDTTMSTAELFDQLAPGLDAQTINVIERHRSGGRSQGRGWLVRRALALADMLGLSVAFVAAMVWWAGSPVDDHVSDALEVAIFLLSMPAWVLAANLYGLYSSDEERTDHSTADDLVRVFHLVTVGSWVLFLGITFTSVANPSLQRLITFWVLAIVLITSLRALARGICRRTSIYLQNTVIVGAGDVGQLVARKLRQHPEYGLNVVGFVDAQPKERQPGLGDLSLLGTPERLSEIVRALEVERVVVAFSNESHEETLDLIRSLKDQNVQIDIVPRLFEVIGTNVGMHTAEGMPMIGLPPLRLSHSALLTKRLLDVTVSLAGLIVFSPVLAAIAIGIKLDSRGPVFFRQVRRGAGDRMFSIYKFRTMRADAEERKAEVASLNKHLAEGGDARMFKIPDDPRVTRFGKFVRRYSLDELPQLINVLRGDMSLVGPRPLILEEDQHVVDWRRRRLNLKPGITGLWQVLGRDGIPFGEMVTLDYLYVTNWSMMGDVKLILRTFPVLFRSHAA